MSQDVSQEIQTVVVVARKPPSDDVIIYSNGVPWGGWTDVRISRGIERCPSDFQLGLTERDPTGQAMPIHPGDACVVKIGSDTVVTGYIDRVAPTIGPRTHSVHVAGRGKCADLVDCDAIWPGGQISGSTVLEIARKLAKPYGIEVMGVGPQGDPIPVYNLIMGETAWEIIERWSRIRQLIPYEDAHGQLVLLAAGGARELFPAAASGFQQGLNVMTGAAQWAMDERYSQYRVLRQSVDTFSDLGDGGNLIAEFQDPGVKRFRQQTLIAEESSDVGFDNARQRGQWEAARRFARSGMVKITTDSWRDAAGALYAPGTRAPVICPALYKDDRLKGNETWVISEVTYVKSESGTSCEVTLMHPAAFSPQPALPPLLVPAEVQNLGAVLGRGR